MTAVFAVYIHPCLPPGVISPRLRTLFICLYAHYDDQTGNGLSGVFTLPFPFLTEVCLAFHLSAVYSEGSQCAIISAYYP